MESCTETHLYRGLRLLELRGLQPRNLLRLRRCAQLPVWCVMVREKGSGLRGEGEVWPRQTTTPLLVSERRGQDGEVRLGQMQVSG